MIYNKNDDVLRYWRQPGTTTSLQFCAANEALHRGAVWGLRIGGLSYEPGAFGPRVPRASGAAYISRPHQPQNSIIRRTLASRLTGKPRHSLIR